MMLVTMTTVWLTCVVQPAADEWVTIQTEFNARMETWMQKMQEFNESGKMIGVGGSLPPHPAAEFRPRVKAYAEEHTNKPEAIPALGWLVANGTTFAPFPVTDDSFNWALEQLSRHHAADPSIVSVMAPLHMASMSADAKPILKFLEVVARDNPDKDVKATAAVTLAEIEMTESPMAAFMGQEKKIDTDKVTRALEGVLAGEPRPDIATRAESLLFRIKHLQVGRPAPALVGRNVEGQEIKLADHKGKVVAIVFWGTWCAPCMQMIPHEREMVAKLADKPFTLMGINVHDDEATVKKTVRKHGITWPTIYDGMEAPIATRWGVRSFPTAYIIDHRGIIRHKNVTPFQLEHFVTALIKEAESTH